ncbi:hypothetical protein ACFYPC_19235 [Streptomyces sp. NPDC005808]|uniref:hypothetical protein n=1 Tax=Streptomyces sp. NPDC005808 TaxID=3364734 RepID=UPI0036C74B44
MRRGRLAPDSRTHELHAELVLRRLLATVRDNAGLRTGAAERIAAHDAPRPRTAPSAVRGDRRPG